MKSLVSRQEPCGDNCYKYGAPGAVPAGTFLPRPNSDFVFLNTQDTDVPTHKIRSVRSARRSFFCPQTRDILFISALLII